LQPPNDIKDANSPRGYFAGALVDFTGAVDAPAGLFFAGLAVADGVTALLVGFDAAAFGDGGGA